jgi:catechol-2,3-dioxygenase
MHIQELSLHTRHIANQKAFYCTTLGLPLLTETTDSFTVQAGTTRLRFQETQQDVLLPCRLYDPTPNVSRGEKLGAETCALAP